MATSGSVLAGCAGAQSNGNSQVETGAGMRLRQNMPTNVPVSVIDSAYNVGNKAAEIRARGIETVIRYYAVKGGQWSGKVLSRSELAMLEAEGLNVAIVYQNNNNKARYFQNRNKGKVDSDWALRHADKLRQPEDTPIYFGVDFPIWDRDPSVIRRNLDNVRAYFELIKRNFDGTNLKIGAYGSGRSFEAVTDLLDYYWLNASVGHMGHSQFYNDEADRWHLFQNKVELRKPYGSDDKNVIDTNVINPKKRYFGQWDTVNPRSDWWPKRDLDEIIDSRAFSKFNPACIYSKTSRDGLKLEGKIGTLEFGRNCRILERFDNFVSVSTDEGDVRRGFCYNSQLTIDLRKVPSSDYNSGKKSAPKCTQG
jgi:hypothetical protein